MSLGENIYRLRIEKSFLKRNWPACWRCPAMLEVVEENGMLRLR